jgi:hypothetical protein
MSLHTILMIAAGACAAVATGGIAGVPMVVVGIASAVGAGLSVASASLAHGASKTAAVDAAVSAAASKQLAALPPNHPAAPMLKAVIAATADDSFVPSV